MNTHPEPLSLEEFPHFKSEWRGEGNHYKHNYSPDLCELKILRAVSMKQLDVYSSREAYSFPFCPRIYKYNIDRNQMIDNQITFDIKLILEYVPHRITSTLLNEQTINKITDIFKAVEYLHTRFGAFRITKGMIGWTDLGVAKVWINEDFCSNSVQEEASCELQMVNDLYGILQQCQMFSYLRLKDFTAIRDIINFMEENAEIKQEKFPKKQALQQIQNNQNSQLYFEGSCKKNGQIEYRSSSRKNITFSYSNKNIAQKPPAKKCHNFSKRSSIAIVDDDFRWGGKEQVATPNHSNHSFQFGSNNQSSSLKIIQQNKTKHMKKMSVFRPTDSHEKSVEGEGLKIKNLADYFSVNSNTSKEFEGSKINEVHTRIKDKPELLYYSTSCNPYSKLINKKQANDKAMSHHEQCDESISSRGNQSIDKENKQTSRDDVLNLPLTEFSVEQSKLTRLKSSQQLKNDLDALFNSDHEFDYGQLQNELDHIL